MKKLMNLKKAPHQALNFLPCILDSTQQTSWNDALCEKFVEDFEEEQNIKLTSDDKTTIEIMFLDRLNHLVRPWKEWQNFDSDELKAREQRSNKLSRRNTRRVDVSRL